MNYYEKYLGGYAKRTGHLEMAGHGAYNLMLDAYYSTEKPLPPDYGSLYRICRAISKAEQETVRKVADEFFPIGPDGLRHNERADEELLKALKRIATAKTNGKGGGRPSKEPSQNPAGYAPGIPAGSPEETQPKPSGPHMVKPPDPMHQTSTPPVKGGETPNGTARPPLPKTLTEATWAEWRKHLACKGKPMTAPQENLQLARLSQHADPEAVVLETIAKGRSNLPPIGGYESDQQRQTQAGKRSTVAAAIFPDRDDDDRTIDGTAERVA